MATVPVKPTKPTRPVGSSLAYSNPHTKPGVNTSNKVVPKASVEVGGNKNVNSNSALTPVRPAAFKIETVGERTRYLKMLVYANYGVGKTLLAGSAIHVPQMSDVLMISAESGDITLLGDEELNNVDVVVVKDYSTVARVQEFLKRHCKYRDANDEAKLREEQDRFKGPGGDLRRYKTVIIDSLTEVEQYCLYQLLGISDTTKLDEEVASEEWSEYKKNTSMIQRLVRSFRDLPMHVIFTCSQQYVQDENKRKTYSPALTGKLSTKVQGFMDIVGYLTVQEAKEDGSIPRRLSVQPSPNGKYDAKNRFPGYKARYIDIPDVDKGPPGMEVILKAVGLWESTKKSTK